MEGVSSRLGRASSRYGGSAPVFSGPVRKWKKQWVQVSSPVTHSRSHNHHNNSNHSLLLCRWTPISSSYNSGKSEEEPPRRKVRYTPIVVVDEMKKEGEKKAKDDPVSSKTFQSSPRETTKNDIIFRKQDIDSLFMETSQASRNDHDENSDGED